jgi:hypothetical protein
MMRQKVEMMARSGLIFGRSVVEPFPMWMVWDPRCSKIDQDETGKYTKVIETVNGKPVELPSDNGIYAIRLYVQKRLFSDDTQGISSLRSLIRTSNTLNDTMKGLQKFILALLTREPIKFLIEVYTPDMQSLITLYLCGRRCI